MISDTNKIRIGAAAVVCAAMAGNAEAEVRITEIMPSNISTIYSDKYDYNGFAEIYCQGETLDLRGWTAINEKDGKELWRVRLESQHELREGYNILFFGKVETSSGEAKRVSDKYAGIVPQKLTSDAGTLRLTNGTKEIKIDYPKQYPHVSYGDGGYMLPTPGEKNGDTYNNIEDRVMTPQFEGSKPGVVYAGNTASVSLSCATGGAEIYYTLNGSIPTKENGKRYTSPLNITKTTIVRARAYKDGTLYSDVSTGSYLFTNSIYSSCGESNLPIVSITSDSAHLYGDLLGICVKGTNGAPTECSSDMNGNANYNQEWMRPANFEYIVNGEVVDCQEVEVGVFGGCSRSHDVKSFKIKANKRSGANKFKYTKFFADRSYTKYKSLALRNGGNGWYLYPRWRDGYMQSLAKGMDVDYQAYQPVGYFLNGEYKGLMGLRERTDEDYIYSNYGLDEEEIDYLRVMKDMGRYVAQIGTDTAYNAMEQYAQAHNQDADFYDKLAMMMDIDEYIDYQIIQQFIGNTDWVNNNIKLWRKKEGGKFRWILFDVDFGMSKHTSVNNNMLMFCTVGNANDNSGTTPTTPGMGGGFGWGDIGGGISTVDTKFCTLFKGCMENEDFRYKFLDRYAYLLENQFNVERTARVMDSIADLTKAEACAMINYKKESDNSGDDSGNNGGNTWPGMGDWGGGLGDWGGGLGGWGGTTGNGLGGGSQSEYDSGIQSMKMFAQQRPEIVERQLVNYYKVEATKAEVNVSVSVEGGATDYSFMVNKFRTENKAYNRRLFIGERIKVELRVPTGYKVKSCTVDDVAVEAGDGVYVGKVGANGTKIAYVLTKDEGYKIPRLYINEVCASNGSTTDEYGGKPDWIEIYNAEDYDVDLAGMIVRNVTRDVRSEIPYDYSATIIPGKGRVMLWADKDAASGPLHLDFKLSATVKQELELLIPYNGKEELIDKVVYELHDRDGSYGRKTDGAAEQRLFPACSVETKGQAIASPRDENGSVKCEYVSADIADVLAEGGVYPNPTNTAWTVDMEGEFTVTNAAGQVIESGYAARGMRIGDGYAAGVYVLYIGGEVVKVVKY